MPSKIPYSPCLADETIAMIHIVNAQDILRENKEILEDIRHTNLPRMDFLLVKLYALQNLLWYNLFFKRF